MTNITYQRLDEKKRRLDSLKPLPPELVKNLDEWFRIELTYNSNAIEGNTLTRRETATIVEKGLTVEGKTLNEQLEAVNHAKAWDLVKQLAEKKRAEITEQDVLAIHTRILHGIDDTNAGRYRTVSVRISGSEVILPNYLKVPDLMSEFIRWLTGENADHPAKIAADAHYKLVSIHPFADGNGRAARLLNDLLLQQAGFPPALVRNEVRNAYIGAIEKAQLSGGTDMDDYYQVMLAAAEISLDTYLEAAENREPSKKVVSKLLKIGELAELTQETVANLRFWTNMGLLQTEGFTLGGYRLYSTSMADRAKEIRRLQREERRTIQEIKEQLQ